MKSGKTKRLDRFLWPFYNPSEAKPTKNTQNSSDKLAHSETTFKYLVQGGAAAA